MNGPLHFSRSAKKATTTNNAKSWLSFRRAHCKLTRQHDSRNIRRNRMQLRLSSRESETRDDGRQEEGIRIEADNEAKVRQSGEPNLYIQASCTNV